MKIELTPGNIRRDHFYIGRDTPEIPADAWGGSNESESGSSVLFEFAGTEEKVETDIDGVKRIPRNARGQCARFFAHHGLLAGDQIEITVAGARHYRIAPVRTPTRFADPQGGLSAGTQSPARSEATIQRIVRDTSVTIQVKKMYAFKCQVCGVAILTRNGLYAEGAHIRPLGAPHNGPDGPENVLCLCPNHHVMLDRGSLTINDDLTLNGAPGKLELDARHSIDIGHLRYHRNEAQVER